MAYDMEKVDEMPSLSKKMLKLSQNASRLSGLEPRTGKNPKF